MFRELLSRESRFPPLLGTGLAAVLMGAVAVASAQASLPSREEAAARMAPMVAPPQPAARPHIAQPKFAFASPLTGFAVNSPFGLRKMPWEEGGRLHEGVDIAAPVGTAIRVTLAGTVLRTGVDGGYGRFVEVSHGDGLTSLYAHLGRTAPGLKAGMVIPAGYVVAFVGSTGRSTGAHLHFEIRQDGRPLNPAAFMGRTFASTAELPLTAAARVPRRVRIAQVSDWPAGVAAVARKTDRVVVRPARTDGRVRATIMPLDAGINAPVVRPVKPIAPPETPATAHEAPIATG
ncbi:MAG: M23 family metallopeptidase [Caulobacter sp.]|nr:M23 family metallopeptidase [Caulobacter sp.]